MKSGKIGGHQPTLIVIDDFLPEEIKFPIKSLTLEKIQVPVQYRSGKELRREKRANDRKKKRK